MGNQEQMTPNTASGAGPGTASGRPRAEELAAGPVSGHPADRGLRAWLRTRSRAARLVMTSTAALTAVVVALLALSVTSGGGAPKAAARSRPGLPRRSAWRSWGTLASISRSRATPATP